MSLSTSAARVLIVDDDEKLCRQIGRFLEPFGFAVQYCHDGAQAVTAVREQAPDLVILDLMLPGADGFEICRAVRPFFRGQVLMLTASGDDMDHVAGIETGADDFLVKPVHPRVLLARIKLLLRRAEAGFESRNAAGAAAPSAIELGQLRIALPQRTVQLLGKEIELTPSEFDLLVLLATKANEVISREAILQALRGVPYDGLDRSVDVKVAALRKKLGDNPKTPKGIITVRAKGYLLSSEFWNG